MGGAWKVHLDMYWKTFFFGTNPYNSEMQVVGEHAEHLGIGIIIS